LALNSADSVKLAIRAQTLPGDPGQWQRGEPLWKLAPKRDSEGHPYIDFMMLAPRSLLGFGIVGCKSTAPAPFLPASCSMEQPCGGESGKKRPRRGRFSLSTTKVQQAPSLKKRPAHEIECLTRVIQAVLERFEHWVVFADFNLKLNVLWVSLTYRPGIMSEVVAALRAQAPELKLVAHNPDQRG
jgi:hypothetical protein